ISYCGSVSLARRVCPLYSKSLVCTLMIVPATWPASEFQVTWSPTVNFVLIVVLPPVWCVLHHCFRCRAGAEGRRLCPGRGLGWPAADSLAVHSAAPAMGAVRVRLRPARFPCPAHRS